MDIPSSVYRLQLNSKFPLKKAISILPYLRRLGVDAVYCSPIFACSNDNGYEVTNPNLLSPLLGTRKDYEKFCAQIKKLGMKQILDIVPNHMSILGEQNLWWIDVMKNGPFSRFAKFFDIHWNSEGKLVLPILNETYENVLKKINLKKDRGYWICYNGFCLPIAKHSYSVIKSRPLDLRALLEQQYYRLSYWEDAEIDYRRFFNLNHLIGIHIENKQVLQAHHHWVFELLKKEKISGLRIDHIDGLYNPTEYLKRLVKNKPHLIFVEKILMPGEQLPVKWPIDGTVGYEYLNLLNGLFIDKKSERSLTRTYEKFIEKSLNFENILYFCRKRYVQENIQQEIKVLASLARTHLNYPLSDLAQAIQDILICFPVYRTYVLSSRISQNDRTNISKAVGNAQKISKLNPNILIAIKKLLLKHTEFGLKFQQLTPSIMAKGLEDSSYYIYNRLISLNEVGGYPKHFGSTVEDFHGFNKEKLAKYPYGLLASSTHDTKYSEDFRMRLAVLSELPNEWGLKVEKWKKWNKKHKTLIGNSLFPDFNTEYYLYQMLLGIWPCTKTRLWHSFQKILREAGIFTSWKTPNESYENAAKKFLFSILKPQKTNHFLSSFLEFRQKIARCGHWNSLSALVLKICSCGIPDIYQGEEDWNYCLVDPDNRQPIDYKKRKNDLRIKGSIKQWVTHCALQCRNINKELLLKGSYTPLKTRTLNQRTAGIVAFMREHRDRSLIVIARRFFTQECHDKALELILPKIKAKELQDIFTKRGYKVKRTLSISDVLYKYPFAILVQKKSPGSFGSPSD
jgi:(1->4)-alpha-D-glucan 1-alpha-D-glucosylmutase